MDISILITILQWAIPVILAITLHEAAHGYVARLFGDPTAHLAGRITLNPIKHIDPIGTLLVPALLLASAFATGLRTPIFGWAKPVPVDFGRLRRPKRDMLWVAAAGPGSNLVQAFAWALIGGFVFAAAPEPSNENFAVMAGNGVYINVVLMLLNLVPIPPLDGGRIAVSLLPNRLAYAYSRLEPYGFFILIALLFTGILSIVLTPAIRIVEAAIYQLTGA